MSKGQAVLKFLSKGQTRAEKIAEKLLDATTRQIDQNFSDNDGPTLSAKTIDAIVDKHIHPVYYGMQTLIAANIITTQQLDDILANQDNAEHLLQQIEHTIAQQTDLIDRTISAHRDEIIRATKLSANAYEQKLNELSNNVMPVMQVMMDAWTKTDIQGFENETNVVQLKTELDHLVATSANPKIIAGKAIELKDAKTEIILARQNFDQVMQNAHHIVDGASALGVLFGKPRLAKEINVICNSAVKLGTLIAGYCGYGTLAAGINPFAAASMLLGCAGDIALLGRSEPDNNYLMLQQIQQLLGQMYSAMHERFDEVMQALDVISRKQLHQFLMLSGNQEAILNRLELQEQRFTRTQDSLQNYSVEILQTLNHMLQSNQVTDKETTLLEIRQNVNEKVARAEGGKQKGNAYYDEAHSHILNYIHTSGSGITHKNLIGTEVNANQLASIDNIVDIHPYFSLQTIYSYCKSLDVDSLNMPSLIALQDKLNLMFTNQTHHALTPVVTLGLLLFKETNQTNLRASSLLRFIKEERDREINRIVAPIYLNGRWSLLVVDKRENQAFYISCGNNEEANQRIIHILEASGIVRENIHIHTIETNITPSRSHTWLLESIHRLFSSNDLTVWSEDIKRLTITEEIQSRHQVAQTKDMTQPSNPVVVQYLAYKLLELTHTEYKKLGTNEENLSTSELVGIQDMLHVSDTFYQLLSQLSQPELFTKLISDYQATRNEFEQALNEDLAAFETTISNEMNIQTKEAAKNNYYSAELQAFLNEAISIGTQYGNWYNLKSYRNWTNSRHARDSRPNVDHGNIDSQHLATAYVNQRTNEIATYKSNYVTNRQTTFNQLNFTNSYHAFSDHRIQKVELPVLTRPLTPDAIWIPAFDYFLNYLPEHTKSTLIKAQACLVGQLCFTSQMTADRIIININFKLPEREIQFACLEAAHDPSFFTGKEKFWWDVIGGDCAQSATGVLTHVKTVQEDKRNSWASYAHVPTIASREGLVSKAASNNALFTNVLDETNANANLAIIQQRIDDFNNELQNRYARELLLKLHPRSESRLGAILVLMNAQYKILKLLSELLFSNQYQDTNSIIHQFFNQSIRHRESVQTHLTNNRQTFIGAHLVSAAQIEAFKNETHRLLNLTLGLGRSANIDVLQSHLLDCANDIAVNLMQRRTNSEQAQFYKKMNEMVDQGVNKIMTTLATQPERLPELLTVYQKASEIKRRVEDAFENDERMDMNQLLEGVRRELLAIEAPAPRPVTGTPATLFAQPQMPDNQARGVPDNTMRIQNN